MNDNNMNQNVAPEVNPTVAPVADTPAAPEAAPVAPVAPVEVPVQPVPETPVAPVEVPVQPVAPAPEPQPMPAEPIMDLNPQFSTQPTEQPAVQPAVQPGVPPVAPDPIAQPVVQPAGEGVAMQPKKKSSLPFILIVILLLAVIGGLAAFLIYNNTKDSGSSSNKNKTEEKAKKDDTEKEKPKEVADATKVTVGEYNINLPKGYSLYSYEDQTTILVDNANQVQITLAEVPNLNISTVEQNITQLKSNLEAGGFTVGDYGSGDIGTVKWLAMEIQAEGHHMFYLATDLNTDLLEVYAFSGGTKEYRDIVLGINDVLSSAAKSGSSFSGKKEAINQDKFKVFDFDAFK